MESSRLQSVWSRGGFDVGAYGVPVSGLRLLLISNMATLRRACCKCDHFPS